MAVDRQPPSPDVIMAIREGLLAPTLAPRHERETPKKKADKDIPSRRPARRRTEPKVPAET